MWLVVGKSGGGDGGGGGEERKDTASLTFLVLASRLAAPAYFPFFNPPLGPSAFFRTRIVRHAKGTRHHVR